VQRPAAIGFVGVKISRHNGRLRRCGQRAGQCDDAHGTLGVDRVGVVRLTLVGHDGVAAVGRDADHVGQGSNRDGTENCGRRGGGVEEDEPAGIRFAGRFDGHRAEAIGTADTRGAAASAAQATTAAMVTMGTR
jgi:hypothetical protein